MPHSKVYLFMNYFALRGFPINMNTLNCFVIIRLQSFTVLYGCLQAVYKCPCKHGGLLCSSALLTLKKHGTENKIVIFCHFIKVKYTLNAIQRQIHQLYLLPSLFTVIQCTIQHERLVEENLSKFGESLVVPQIYHPNFNKVSLMT